MSLLIDHRLQGLNFDKTVKCKIITDKGNGTYLVQESDTVKYEAISAGIAYKPDEWVYVTIPNGNYNSTKVIISKYTENPTENPINYIPPLGTFVPMTENLAANLEGTSQTYGILANGSSLPEKLREAGESLILERIAEFDLANHKSEEIRYNEIYDTIGLSADFKTLFNGLDMQSGSYGLRLFLIEEGKNPTIADFDSSEMFGDPFAYNFYLTQSKKFDISTLGNIDRIILVLYQKDNFRHYDEEGNIADVPATYTMLGEEFRKPDNILVQNIALYLGKDIMTIADDTFELSVPGGESTKMKYDKNSQNEAINTKTIYATWYNKTEDNEFIGFSDGVVDKEYTEDAYMLELETQMAGAAVGTVSGIPSLKESLQIYSNAQQIEREFKTIYNRVGTDLQTVLTNLYTFINNNGLLDDGKNDTTIASKFKPIVEFDRDGDIVVNKGSWQAYLNTYAIIDYDGAQSDNNDSFWDKYIKYLNESNDYIKYLKGEWVEEKAPNKPVWGGVSTRFNQNKTAWTNLKEEINGLYSFIKQITIDENHHGDIRAYVDRNTSQMNQYISYIDSAFSTIENVIGQSETQITNFDNRLTNKDLTTFEEEYAEFQKENANKYCIYWYRKDASAEGDRWTGPGWKRLEYSPIDTTPGMPAVVEGKYEKRSNSPLTIKMNYDVAKDNFKAVLFFNHIAHWSNELEFENLSPPIDTSGADLTGALFIELSHNASASYQKYSSSLSLLNMSDAMINRETIIRYKNADATEGDEVLAGCWIYWYMPLNATMLKADESRLTREGFSILSAYKDNNEFKEDYLKYKKDGYECYFKQIRIVDNKDDTVSPDHRDITFYHLIKPVFNPAYTQNEIKCTVNRGGVDYTASYLFTFSTFGTSGTDFTLSIAPTTTQYAVERVDTQTNNPLPLRASFSGYDGSTVEDPPAITTSWWGVPVPTGQINPAGEPVEGAIDYTVTFNTDLNSDDNCLYRVMECQAEWGKLTPEIPADQTITLKSYYPIATAAGMYYMTGPTTVVYDDMGHNPIYSNEAYKLFYRTTNEEIQDLTWKLIHYKTDKNGGNLARIKDTESDLLRYLPTMLRYKEKNAEIYSYKLQPLTMYVDKTYCYSVAVAVNKDGQQIFAQPLFIFQNRYGSPMINTWDEKLQIDEENNTILTSMIGAGYKDDENRFCGVFMGNVGEKLNNDSMGVGVYGVNEGYQSFGLTVDGKAFFGKSGRGQIKIDGNKGTIKSASYDLNNGDSGMLVDLDDGFIDMKGTTEYVEADFDKLSAKDKRGYDNYTDYKARFGPIYKTDTTSSHIRLDVKSPYFQITSAAGHGIIHIADNAYYLQSDNYNSGIYDWTDRKTHESLGTGTKFDLQNGFLDAYNLKIQSKNVLLDSSAEANPYFIIKDDDGCNLFYAGTKQYYFQTCGYTKRVAKYQQKIDDNGNLVYDSEGNPVYTDTEIGRLTPGIGTKIDLQKNNIDAYNFTIRGEQSSGSYLLLSSKPILRVHLAELDENDIYIKNLDLLYISPSKFIMHSIDWYNNTSSKTKTINIGTVTGVTSYLNVRSGPGEDFKIVGSLKNKQEVEVFGKSSDGKWWSLVNGNPQGDDTDGQWVSANYLSVSSKDIEEIEGTTSGAEINMNTGKLTFHKDNKTILLNSGAATYPLQIGPTNKYNLKFGWDGSIRGGSKFAWSILADGTATFNSLNANGGTFSNIKVTNANISGGYIGNATVTGLTVTDRFTFGKESYGPQDISLSYITTNDGSNGAYVIKGSTQFELNFKSAKKYSTTGSSMSSLLVKNTGPGGADNHVHSYNRMDTDHVHSVTVDIGDLVEKYVKYGEQANGQGGLLNLVLKTTTGRVLATGDIETSFAGLP